MPSTHDYISDPRNDNVFIYINGDFFYRSEAKVSVLDSGFLLGDGVWEGIRLHNGCLIHVDRHLDRLYDGAKKLRMKIGVEKFELRAIILKTIKKNRMFSDVHIRLIVTRGLKKTPYQSPKINIGKSTIVIIPEYKKPNKEVIKKGISIATVKTIRDHVVQDPKINSLSKFNCIAACIEAEELGVDEGLMLDPNGYVATCNSTNFFIIRSGKIWTSTGEYCLNGVTRHAVIELCKNYNIPVFKKNFTVKDVLSCDEAFVTGTFAGIIPVININKNKIGNGTPGFITKNLQDYYFLSIEKISSKYNEI
tara:strand:- start:84055 stop:84975 length:921 start_codon:yes stop_codon:yes gene_type:complete